jgi:hypothetical protein
MLRRYCNGLQERDSSKVLKRQPCGKIGAPVYATRILNERKSATLWLRLVAPVYARGDTPRGIPSTAKIPLAPEQ